MQQLNKLKDWLNTEKGQGARDRVGAFIRRMDERSFVRLSVCVFPGALAAQLVSQFHIGQPAGMLSTGLVICGLIVYGRWTILRNRMKGLTDEGDASANEAAYANEDLDSAASMQELLALHGGDENLATHAVMVEMQMDRSLNWDAGVLVALQRKQAIDRLASANGLRLVKPRSGN